ncbi:MULTISPECIES: substrate-binding domain-containing protein [unclassified Diaminobutyricimonas]|uniref:sugar ABC transporter substrate-binding protein n=1 Tax=unclassified Diaminobutyricimonas TaxID=2643261 RepID=UPI0012F525AA|nr:MULTISPECIES: substrate-binding domain-containing protein [unclassified Diaminobutyricimonas]
MKRNHSTVRAAIVAAAILALTACSAATDEVATTDDVELTAEAAAAQGVVDSISASFDEFEAPGPALENLAALEGKTVHYVAATLQVPLFTVVADTLETALSNVGVDLQVCDGKANPQSMATCLDQAVQAGAGAVISGSIPYELASVAFDSVTAAGIPLLYTQVAPAGPGEPTKVGYLTPNNVEMEAWIANWVIADSNAQAEVLTVTINDTPATILWMEAGAHATYEKGCPDCKVTKVDINTGQLDKLPSLISSTLVANPGIKYIHAEADSLVQSIQQGLQSAGLAQDEVHVISMEGSLAVMQMLADERFMQAEVGMNLQAFAWYAADQTLRMMSGQPSTQNLAFPYRRLFTAESANELELTPAAEASGAWYGDADYENGFLELWGAK